MIKIGITGHQKLEKVESWLWIENCLRKLLSEERKTIIGITSLALGADQLFARLLLELKGLLYVIIPFPDYENKFETKILRSTYNSYLKQAYRIETLEYQSTDEEGYLNAGRHVVDLSDKMIAIWNGKIAIGLGGTGDIVEYCWQIKKEVIHINPNEKQITKLINN